MGNGGIGGNVSGSANRKSPLAARRWRRVLAGGAPVILGLASLDAHAAPIFAENFDGLALRPFVSPSESGGSGSDWTDVPPDTWVRDNTTTPSGGPAEFYGFTFMNKASCVATESDQDRSQFASGSGTVMVADPDAYDDGDLDIEPNLFNVFMSTPPIPLAGVARGAGAGALRFDSSFRPYDGMTASVDVSFDGGQSFSNLLTMNAGNSGGDSSLTRVNEAVSLPLDLPDDASSMVVRFGMTNAGNDWWWAVDNIAVDAEVVPEPSGIAALLGAAGLAALSRRRRS